MARLHQLFSLGEIQDMDEQQRELLREVIRSEIRSNKDIHAILSARLHERLGEFRNAPRRGTSTRTPGPARSE
jgi:hypothetical protein